MNSKSLLKNSGEDENKQREKENEPDWYDEVFPWVFIYVNSSNDVFYKHVDWRVKLTNHNRNCFVVVGDSTICIRKGIY